MKYLLVVLCLMLTGCSDEYEEKLAEQKNIAYLTNECDLIAKHLDLRFSLREQHTKPPRLACYLYGGTGDRLEIHDIGDVTAIKKYLRFEYVNKFEKELNQCHQTCDASTKTQDEYVGCNRKCKRKAGFEEYKFI